MKEKPMHEQNETKAEAVSTSQNRLRAKPPVVLLEKLKAERVEDPMAADEVRRRLRPGWRLLTSKSSLVRTFHLPGEREAKIFSEFLFMVGANRQVGMKIALAAEKVELTLVGRTGRHGGVTPSVVALMEALPM
jgi:hypothetical protein